MLATLTHLTALTISPSLFSQVGLKASLIVALVMGLFNGITTGIIHQVFNQRFFHNRALWIVIAFKAFISMIVFLALIFFVRYSMYPYLVDKMFGGFGPASRDDQWHYLIYLLLVFDVFAGLVISFFNLVHDKYGPGVMMPLLLGKYRSPKEEERIFLFMDLKSSTAIAEELGHLKYSAFIRDSFLDINAVLAAHHARVYQYVGDEIVLTWTTSEGLSNMACIDFFFACQERFAERNDHYEAQYGRAPEFKAGLHMGIVTAVEVGNIKKDIAYHGDTLNTASRIQSVCNQYGKSFLLSEKMLARLPGTGRRYHIEHIGTIMLKGKSRPVGIASIQAADDEEPVPALKGKGETL
jgi:adenylate cyclase